MLFPLLVVEDRLCYEVEVCISCMDGSLLPPQVQRRRKIRRLHDGRGVTDMKDDSRYVSNGLRRQSYHLNLWRSPFASEMFRSCQTQGEVAATY